MLLDDEMKESTSQNGEAAACDKTKKSFLLHKDCIDSVENLTDDEAGKLFKAILCWQNGIDVSDFDRVTKLLLNPFIAQFKRENLKWQSVREERVKAGKKGGLAKSSKSQANGSKSKQSLANLAVNGSVSVSGSVSGSVSEEKVSSPTGDSSNSGELGLDDGQWNGRTEPIPIKRIFALYSEKCPSLKQMQVESEKRRIRARQVWEKAKAYAKKKVRTPEGMANDEEHWRWHYLTVLFETAECAGWLRGDNNRGWKADFEFVCRDESIAKILEGYYER